MAADVATLVEQIRTDWETYKQLNDAALEEAKQHGEASAEAKAAADRANAAIETAQRKLDELEAKRAEDETRIKELEDRQNRLRLGGGGGKLSDERIERYAAWQAAVTGKEVDPAHVDLELISNYRQAFNQYLRSGHESQILNELQVGSDPDGGFFVDPDTSGRLVEFIHETSPVRQLANVQLTTGDALEGMVELGEAGFGWVGEQESRPETDTPTVFEWRIPLMEQYAMPQATQRILDQGNRDVASWLEGKVRRRFARGEATAFVSGNGEKRPRGFLTYTAGTPGSTAATWPQIEQVVSGAAAALTADGLIDLVFALKTDYMDGAVIGARRDTERLIRQLKDQNDQYLWQPDFTERSQSRVLGLPFVEMADVPAVAADALAVVAANFAEAYQIADSPVGIRVLRDPFTTKGKVKFYTTRYVGGDVVNFEAIKIQKIST